MLKCSGVRGEGVEAGNLLPQGKEGEKWTEKLGEKEEGRKKGKRKNKCAQRENGTEKENKIAVNIRKLNIFRAFYMDVFQKNFATRW